MTDSQPQALNASQPSSPDPATPDQTPQASPFGHFPILAWLSTRPRIHWLYGGLLIVILGIIGWFYAPVIDTELLGFTHDDGVYAIVGQALSLGKGFTLLHVVGHPAQIKYPFIYPAILALVWLVNPHFPQNLPALNYVTTAFTFAAMGLFYMYLRQCHKFPGWLALLLIPMIMFNFYFIYFFSTVMSEAPYLFASLLTLWVFYQLQKKQPVLSSNSIWILIALSAITFLTRVTGVALMAAIGTWLLLNRQWRNALLYGAGCLALSVFPWMLWVKFNTPVITAMNYPLVNTYSNYGLEFAHNFTTGGNYLAALQNDLFSLITHLLEDMVVFIPNALKLYPKLAKAFPAAKDIVSTISLTCAYLLFGYFVLQSIHTLRQACFRKQDNQRIFNPSAFSVPGLYLFYYVMLITLWNYQDQMARFMTVVTPLFWLYFFKPLVSVLPEWKQPFPQAAKKAWAAIIVVLLAAGLTFISVPNTYHTVYLSRTQHWVESGKYRWMWSDYKSTFNWIKRELPPNARLAATSDVVLYLYTGHPTFYIHFASLRRENGVFLPSSIPLLMQSLDYYHVQYLVAEPHMEARRILFPVNIVTKQLLEAFPKRFKRLYGSPHQSIHVYQILPPKALQTANHSP